MCVSVCLSCSVRSRIWWIVLKAEARSHVEDLLWELYLLNCTNFYEYLLICSIRQLREMNMIAPIKIVELFENKYLNLHRLCSVHLRVQWPKIWSHGCNRFAFMGSQSYNRNELNGEWFGDEDTFKAVAKWRGFISKPSKPQLMAFWLTSTSGRSPPLVLVLVPPNVPPNVPPSATFYVWIGSLGGLECD